MTGDFFKFEKRCQFFIGVHNETLSVVAICVAIQIVRSLESKAETPGDFFFPQILILLDCDGNVNQLPCQKPKRKLPSANRTPPS